MIGTHPDVATFLETYTTGWDTGRKRDATAYLKVLTDFDFIVGIISLYRLLHPVAPIMPGSSHYAETQGSTVVIAAFNDVKDCIDDMKTLRENVEGEFSNIYQQAERTAAKFGVTPSIPRTAARHFNRNNVPALTPEEYSRHALAVPLLDTFVSEIEFRFDTFSTKASKVPTVLCSDIYTGQLHDLVNMYKEVTYTLVSCTIW